MLGTTRNDKSQQTPVGCLAWWLTSQPASTNFRGSRWWVFSVPAVAWKVVMGPDPVARGRDDALGRVFVLEYVLGGVGERRSVEVWVTSEALSFAKPGRYRDGVLLAMDTDGRSEVERVLNRLLPPRRIELASDGRVETLF